LSEVVRQEFNEREKDFEELVDSVREAGRILRGEVVRFPSLRKTSNRFARSRRGGVLPGGCELKVLASLLLCSLTLSACVSAAPSAERTPAHRAVLEYLSHEKPEIVLNDLRKIGERGPSGASGTIVRFEQLHRGVRIVGALLICEVNSNGGVRVRTNELRSVDVSVIPAIEARDAIETAAASLRISERNARTELVIVPAGAIDGVAVDTLSWWVTLESRGAWRVLVDAMSGKVLHSEQMLPRD
jgi:hypothetical protein